MWCDAFVTLVLKIAQWLNIALRGVAKIAFDGSNLGQHHLMELASHTLATPHAEVLKGRENRTDRGRESERWGPRKWAHLTVLTKVVCEYPIVLSLSSLKHTLLRAAVGKDRDTETRKQGKEERMHSAL